jgi:LacI family transcriptional regulator
MTRRSSSVTIRDVAWEAGVSVATASRYINRNAPVSLEVAERLDKVMTGLRYMPLLSGIASVIGQKGYNLIIATYHANSREYTQPLIGPHNTDGLLVFSDCLTDDDLASLTASGFPIVLVHRTPPATLSIPGVTVENVESIQRLVDHLINVNGRRRILFLRGPIHQDDSIRRELGYKNALHANGIPFDETLVFTEILNVTSLIRSWLISLAVTGGSHSTPHLPAMTMQPSGSSRRSTSMV